VGSESGQEKSAVYRLCDQGLAVRMEDCNFLNNQIITKKIFAQRRDPSRSPEVLLRIKENVR
jgi:hypothetical protein